MTTKEIAERIGHLVDEMDNIYHATYLNIDHEIHMEQIRSKLAEWRDFLRIIYMNATFEDPWEDEPWNEEE